MQGERGLRAVALYPREGRALAVCPGGTEGMNLPDPAEGCRIVDALCTFDIDRFRPFGRCVTHRRSPSISKTPDLPIDPVPQIVSLRRFRRRDGVCVINFVRWR